MDEDPIAEQPGSDPTPEEADPRASLGRELAALDAQGRLRRRPIIDSPDRRAIVLLDGGRRRTVINWASNDYLGCAWRLKNRNAAGRAARRYGAGSGAARLLAGGLRCHRRLEERLARWLGYEDALLTTTGYQANLAALSCLASSRNDALILDRRCHASLYDGARLAAGRLLRFTHNDCRDLEARLLASATARRRIVVVESVYSMDGDEAPLPAVAELCQRHRALLAVDEAHALGVYGPGGRGCCAQAGLRPDILVGTCSKALGSQGGFILADRAIIETVVNAGRSFIYTTAPCPAASGGALAGLDLLREDPEVGARLLARAGVLRRALAKQGWSIPDGRGPIIPVIVGDETSALRLAAALKELGHYAPAIRPPTVPAGSCRIRLTVTAAHREADLRRLVATMSILADSRDAKERPCSSPS